LEQALPGKDARRCLYDPLRLASFHAAAAETITELHRRTASQRRLNAAMVQSMMCEPLQRICAATVTLAPSESISSRLEKVRLEIIDSMSGRNVALSWVHGDYWADNVLFDPGTGRVTGVLDWDRASPAGLPPLDLVHLLIQTRKLLARDSEQGDVIRAVLTGGWSQLELEILRRGLWPVPQTQGDTRLIVLLYWLDRMAILLRQNPHRGRNKHWVAKNIGPVLPCL
jgi:Ser/Thr protein kinase RdoA (MazF antagonist)